MQNIFLGWAH